MNSSPFLVFAGLALVVVLTPGADTILVLRMSSAHGARTGIATALGVVTGPVIWGALSGVGVALIVTRNATLYTALALLGAAYLLYLAVGCFRSAAAAATSIEAGLEPRAIRPRNAYVTGLLTNLLNPKIGVFYLAVMPGLFLGQHLDLWIGGSLGLIQACIGLAFLSCAAWFATRSRRFLTGPRSGVLMETVAGLCLLTFSLCTAWSVLQES
ncbi:LysE family translocator [Saccharopolyspora sp. NPDC049357]|uniref:LysE family translocator n=1 Tax=Saccharopolyspora sp. NPDC049357 TaxID=3154507 RepID=UPI0034283E50